MKTDERILQFFAEHEGEYLSGETLAKNLDISRAAVWKVIKKLTEQGHTIDSQHHVGYRYQSGNVLSIPMIRQLAHSDWQIKLFDSIDSTNTYAKEALTRGDVTVPTMIVANQQIGGRGRLGRTFVSPSDTGLYISFALPLPLGTSVVPGLLTTGTAVAVSRAIKQTIGIELDFKWVNDLLFENRKVGGILTEAVMDFESQQVSAIIVGIGLNLRQPYNLDATLENKVGGMVEHLTVSRNVIVAALLDEFVKLYAEYTDGSFLTAYRQRNIVINQTVTLKYGKEIVTGIVKEIDDQGQLLVDTGDDIRTINSGEVLKVQLPNNSYRG
ncbi:biotin--[acetyl-CoA-carboxylase] ligase [Leuconostoc inhae]|uniref:biotin--[acetyl-CoA-carboxylase] ligase n=1 Tax=Leuconostoc inhae TaxID=178001 RepID=UPI001C7E1830|nr:biotin--[acetyl-CoA-carboxylase] ligase [Leuconostoc inhae]